MTMLKGSYCTNLLEGSQQAQQPEQQQLGWQISHLQPKLRQGQLLAKMNKNKLELIFPHFVS